MRRQLNVHRRNVSDFAAHDQRRDKRFKGSDMRDKQAMSRGAVSKLHPVASPPVDAETASMIDLLQEHLRLAREGKLRSLAVVSVSADGTAIGTQWSCEHGDTASLIGKLTVLTHDLMASRT
jgi:hypothetical protein